MYILERKLVVNQPIGKVWAFFSNPANLKHITPPEMDFSIQSGATDKTYAGQIICYKVSVLPMVRLKWVTEITQLEEGKFFIDEQRFGPYRFWHHQHHFKDLGGKTEMTDIVHYKLPLLPFTGIANKLFVRRQLEQIFDYRTQQVEKLLGL